MTDSFIGTDMSGTQLLGNGTNGVEITAGAGSNTIGGTAVTLISGNDQNGISINGSSTCWLIIERSSAISTCRFSPDRTRS